MAFCAVVDRTGYLPVHNKIYSQPQRPGRPRLEHRQQPQTAASSTIRPGSRRGQNLRAYLIQSYGARQWAAATP